MEKRNGTDTWNKRDFGADVVRIAAMVLLLWVHFYLRNGFYSAKAEGISGFLAVSFRPVFLCCVPLFLILTGYLKCKKKWTVGYYRSLLPILTSWILISGIHFLYKRFRLGESADVVTWLTEFLQFRLANYSWYVGMYFGLFALSPILNAAWENCGTKRKHQAMVLTLIGVTFLPSTVNSIAGQDILPAYFVSMYYVTYYVIGCWIRTYRTAGKSGWCLAAVGGLGMLQAAVNLLTRTEAGNYYSGYSAGYSNLLIAAMAVLLFLACYQLNCQNIRIRKAAARVSGTVLEIYLISWIFDTNIYVLFSGQYPMYLYPWIGLGMTGAVFLLSFAAGSAVHLISRKICRIP